MHLNNNVRIIYLPFMEHVTKRQGNFITPVNVTAEKYTTIQA